MSYVVMVSRPTEDENTPIHRFRLTDDQGQAMTFSDRAQAEAARTRHLSDFPSDQATVMTSEEAGALGSAPDSR